MVIVGFVIFVMDFGQIDVKLFPKLMKIVVLKNIINAHEYFNISVGSISTEWKLICCKMGHAVQAQLSWWIAHTIEYHYYTIPFLKNTYRNIQ